MNDLNNMLSRMMGCDTTKEVINLWYEVTYLRLLLTNILKANPDMEKLVKQEDFEKARTEAQEILLTKFPNMGINFPKQEVLENSSSESQSSP